MYILSRTVSKLLQIIGQICAFEAPFGGLGAGYDVDHRLTGKRVVDFLLVIMELFLLAVKLMELRANRLESAVLEGGGSRRSKISDTRGHPPLSLCAPIDECLTTLPLNVFTQRNFVADFIRGKPNFLYGKRKKLSSLRPPLGG